MRKLRFTVDRIEFVGAAKFMIGGGNCQDELRRGDRLRVHDKTEPESAPESAPEFCIDEIKWYNRKVVTVPPGHSAGLFFPIELARLVRLGDELRGQSDA